MWLGKGGEDEARFYRRNPYTSHKKKCTRGCTIGSSEEPFEKLTIGKTICEKFLMSCSLLPRGRIATR